MSNIDSSYFKIEDQGPKNKPSGDRVEDIISSDEQILLRLQPNRRVFILESIFKGLPVALLWGAFDAFFIIMLVTNNAIQGAFFWVFIIVFFGIHLIPLWSYIAHVIKRVAGMKNYEYVFTSHRVIIKSGLIGMKFQSFYYSAITSNTVKVGIFDRMFHVGDIYLQAGEEKGVIEDIDHPYQYSSKIEKITVDLKTDMAYPNDLRPEENHGYKTQYKG